jgi:hypothetical protein
MSLSAQPPLSASPAAAAPATSEPLDADLLEALEISKLEYASSSQSHHYQDPPPAAPAPLPSPGLVGYARPSPPHQPTTHQFEAHTSPLHTQLPLVSPASAPPPSNSFPPNISPYTDFDQEESDRLQALALQEEFHRQAEEMSHEQYIHGGGGGGGAPQSSAEMILGKKIHPEDLERYKEAERRYLSSLQQNGGPSQQQQSGRRVSSPPATEASRCIVQ